MIQGRIEKDHGNGFGVGMQGMPEKGKRLHAREVGRAQVRKIY